MVENLIFTDKEAAFLKELTKNKVSFIVVGLSAAALQGAPVVTQDVDLWFKNLNDPMIKKSLKKVGGSYIPPTMQNPPIFSGKNVSLFDVVVSMHGLQSFSKEIKNTVEVKIGKFAIHVLKLERIIASKKSINRQKDKLVLPVLEDVLKTIRETEKNPD